MRSKRSCWSPGFPFFLLAEHFRIVLLFISILPLGLHAQDDDVGQYFDDGGISNARHFFGVDLASAAAGDLLFSYEFNFSRILALEVTGGVLLPMNDLNVSSVLLRKYESIPENEHFGTSFRIHPKIYFAGDPPEGLYWGILFRGRRFELRSDYELMYSTGMKFLTSGRNFFEFYVATGVRYYELYTNPNYLENFDFFYAFALAIKYGRAY